MSDSRPLNPDEPYYTWAIEPPSGISTDSPSMREGGLFIYSECCADRFSFEEERVLLEALASRHGFTLIPQIKE